MNKIIFGTIIMIASLFLLPVVNVMGESEVGVETKVETKTEIKIGSENENESETKIETETKSETKAEVKSSEKSNEERKSEKSNEKESNTKTTAESDAEVSVSLGGVAVMESKMSTGTALKSSYSKPEPSSKSSVTVVAQNHLYEPKETIRIEGSIWTNLASKLSASNSNVVSLKVMDKNNNVVHTVDATADANGNYSAEFALHENGKYSVTSSLAVDTGISEMIDISSDTSLSTTTSLIIATPQKVTIAVKDHGEFEVEVKSNSNVESVEFVEAEKKVSVVVEGESGTSGVTKIMVPKDLVRGNMMVMIDGKITAEDDAIVTMNTETHTEIEVNYDHSRHTIDVIGTEAVPEFGSVAMVVLAVTIVAIILSTKTKVFPKI